MAETTAIIKTSKGDMTLKLFRDKAPNTVTNFVHLATRGFYDGLVFHRIIKDFMVQGGCPEGSGRGGPGYRHKCETSKDLRHDSPGMLSMANAGPNTNGSQFFITLVPTPWLDGRHTVFGELTEGLSVLEEIGTVRTGMGDRPVEDLEMTSVEIYEDGKKLEAPQPEPETL